MPDGSRKARKRLPPGGLFRAQWFRKQAEPHQPGGYWHTRLMASAIAIELRYEEDTGSPMLKSADQLMDEALTLRAAAAEETHPQAIAEMLAGARALELRAMGGGDHLTTPSQ